MPVIYDVLMDTIVTKLGDEYKLNMGVKCSRDNLQSAFYNISFPDASGTRLSSFQFYDNSVIVRVFGIESKFDIGDPEIVNKAVCCLKKTG